MIFELRFTTTRLNNSFAGRTMSSTQLRVPTELVSNRLSIAFIEHNRQNRKTERSVDIDVSVSVHYIQTLV